MSGATAAARKGRSFKLVGGVFAALVVLGLGFALYVYFAMIRYERVAARHVPPDSTAALYVDLEKVVLYEPFRKHVLPLVDEIRKSPRAGARLARIREETNIDLALDIRELAVARGPGRNDWVLIAGGKFPKQGVTRGLSDVLRAEGIATTLSRDERTLALPSGITLARGDDGVLIVGSSSERLAAALPATDAHRRLGLSEQSPASFVTIGSPVPALATHPAALAVPALRDLGRIERVSAEVELGEPLIGHARIELGGGGDPKLAAERAQALIGALSMLVRLTGSDFAGESRILDSAKAEPADGGAVRVRFEWQRADVDRAAGSLAEAIRVWAQSNPPANPR